MSDPLTGMLKVLDLHDSGASTGKDLFTGPSQWMPHGRVFGGQVLAQSLMAAIRTVPGDRVVHSLHCYFLRPGDIRHDITFVVDRIHDGRSFSTRRTQAYQGAQPIMSMIASFQTEDDGLDHQEDIGFEVPPPESLPSDEEHLRYLEHAFAKHWANSRPFDFRHVNEPIYLEARGDRVAHQAVWMRAKGPMPGDENLHRASLAYASDFTLLEPILRRHGVPWTRDGMSVASLDHAMWFHRYAPVDEWLLYVQESPSAQGGRGLAQGRFYTRDGMLVASVAQEGMVRVR